MAEAYVMLLRSSPHRNTPHLPLPMPVGSNIQARLDLAIEAAREAGESTLRYFRSNDLGVERKQDGSPVTAADKLAEDVLRRRIYQSFPRDAIIGEEHGDAHGDSGFRWIIDPIDGTRSFCRGIPLYATLVGIELDGRVVAGVAEFPALDECLWASDGGGAWWRCGGNKPVRAQVSSTDTLDKAVIDTLPPQSYIKTDRWSHFERLAGAAWRTRGWSDAYSFALVCTGRIDGAIDFGLKIWDIAPFRPILHEAGGRLTSLLGDDNLLRGDALATNGPLHAALLDIISPGA